MNHLIFLTDNAGDPTAAFLQSILLWGGLIAVMYFTMIRPQRKRQKQTVEMQSALKIGDNIVTSSGFYGVIIDITGNVVIVEFGNNKNIRIPIQKDAIAGIAEPVLVEKKEETK